MTVPVWNWKDNSEHGISLTDIKYALMYARVENSKTLIGGSNILSAIVQLRFGSDTAVNETLSTASKGPTKNILMVRQQGASRNISSTSSRSFGVSYVILPSQLYAVPLEYRVTSCRASQSLWAHAVCSLHHWHVHWHNSDGATSCIDRAAI